MKKYLSAALSMLFIVIISGGIPSKVQAADDKVSPQISLSGELRTRLEDVSTPDFQSRETILMRTRLNAEAKLISNTKVYISLQDSRQWGEETITVTTGNEGQAVDLSQAWFQVDKLFEQPLSVKIGRQTLSYGDQRLIGTGDWSNSARRFDAAKLMYNTKALSADIWYAKTAEPASSAASPAPTDRDSYFSGLYVMSKNIPSHLLDLYILNDRNDTIKKDVYTYGARLAGKVSGLDYTGELALQAGDSKDKVKQEAHAYALKAGYTIPAAMNLRIGAEYDYATGNPSPASGDKNKAFDTLYQGAHSLYGFTDDVSWTNIRAFSVSAGIKPLKDLWVGAEYWDYKKAEADAKGSHLGYEFNIMTKYKLNANLELEAAWIRRTAGAAGGKDYYGRAMADGSTSDFAYLQALVAF